MSHCPSQLDNELTWVIAVFWLEQIWGSHQYYIKTFVCCNMLLFHDVRGTSTDSSPGGTSVSWQANLSRRGTPIIIISYTDELTS
jgi:hypothetical protein